MPEAAFLLRVELDQRQIDSMVDKIQGARTGSGGPRGGATPFNTTSLGLGTGLTTMERNTQTHQKKTEQTQQGMLGTLTKFVPHIAALTGINLGVAGLLSTMKEASPMLSAQFHLLNQAMQIFFRPWGNALGAFIQPFIVKFLNAAILGEQDFQAGKDVGKDGETDIDIRETEPGTIDRMVQNAQLTAGFIAGSIESFQEWIDTLTTISEAYASGGPGLETGMDPAVRQSIMMGMAGQGLYPAAQWQTPGEGGEETFDAHVQAYLDQLESTTTVVGDFEQSLLNMVNAGDITKEEYVTAMDWYSRRVKGLGTVALDADLAISALAQPALDAANYLKLIATSPAIDALNDFQNRDTTDTTDDGANIAGEGLEDRPGGYTQEELSNMIPTIGQGFIIPELDRFGASADAQAVLAEFDALVAASANARDILAKAEEFYNIQGFEQMSEDAKKHYAYMEQRAAAAPESRLSLLGGLEEELAWRQGLIGKEDTQRDLETGEKWDLTGKSLEAISRLDKLLEDIGAKHDIDTDLVNEALDLYHSMEGMSEGHKRIAMQQIADLVGHLPAYIQDILPNYNPWTAANGIGQGTYNPVFPNQYGYGSAGGHHFGTGFRGDYYEARSDASALKIPGIAGSRDLYNMEDLNAESAPEIHELNVRIRALEDNVIPFTEIMDHSVDELEEFNSVVQAARESGLAGLANMEWTDLETMMQQIRHFTTAAGRVDFETMFNPTGNIARLHGAHTRLGELFEGGLTSAEEPEFQAIMEEVRGIIGPLGQMPEHMEAIGPLIESGNGIWSDDILPTIEHLVSASQNKEAENRSADAAVDTAQNTESIKTNTNETSDKLTSIFGSIERLNDTLAQVAANTGSTSDSIVTALAER